MVCDKCVIVGDKPGGEGSAASLAACRTQPPAPLNLSNPMKCIVIQRVHQCVADMLYISIYEAELRYNKFEGGFNF